MVDGYLYIDQKLAINHNLRDQLKQWDFYVHAKMKTGSGTYKHFRLEKIESLDCSNELLSPSEGIVRSTITYPILQSDDSTSNIIIYEKPITEMF
jgi:hypothetical protein